MFDMMFDLVGYCLISLVLFNILTKKFFKLGFKQFIKFFFGLFKTFLALNYRFKNVSLDKFQ